MVMMRGKRMDWKKGNWKKGNWKDLRRAKKK
jgi:hypothetical protein